MTRCKIAYTANGQGSVASLALFMCVTYLMCDMTQAVWHDWFIFMTHAETRDTPTHTHTHTHTHVGDGKGSAVASARDAQFFVSSGLLKIM